MNGGPYSPGHHSHGQPPSTPSATPTAAPRPVIPPRRSARHGRHRLGTAGTWTPAVPAQTRHGRHENGATSNETTIPLDASISGSLPLGAPEHPVARPTVNGPRTPCGPERDDGHRAGFLDTPGELPAEVPAPAPAEAKPEDTPTVRRKKVTLTAPPEPTPSEDTGQDILVYEVDPAPAPDGLGTFDLGSVPASVTPPKTWRKAAWFATASSGCVVVALLFAGSVLVSQPSETGTQAINGWTERGGQPTLESEEFSGSTAAPDSTSPADTASSSDTPSSSLQQGAAGSRTSARVSSVVPQAPGAPGSPAVPTSTTAGESPTAPTTTAEPKKPPVAKAQRVKAKPRQVIAPDPELMADRSEYFLNTVTEDPAAAHSVTTGELEAQGPDGLQRKYQDVAYYEVKKIYIDPNRGETVNTVEVTYPDGSKRTEQRVLHFGEDTKIENDGK